MHIGILQCGHTPAEVAEAHGDYDDLFHALFDGHGLNFETWNVVDMHFPESIDAAEGWLITGSRHGAYDSLPFIAPLEDFIRAAHSAKKPMIGICFGHQIVAQALGGRVEKFSGGWQLGPKRYQTPEGREVTLNAWHQDQVITAPKEARTTAQHPGCTHAALTYGGHIHTIQPHPEIPDPVLATYLAARWGDAAYPPNLFPEVKAQMGGRTHEPETAASLAAFLKQAREGAQL
ncbi:MAG: type 1 glutamine amidotransferase [Pseudomonadota bacterium]